MALGVLLLAGCGSSDDDSAEVVDETVSTAEEEATTTDRPTTTERRTTTTRRPTTTTTAPAFDPPDAEAATSDAALCRFLTQVDDLQDVAQVEWVTVGTPPQDSDPMLVIGMSSTRIRETTAQIDVDIRNTTVDMVPLLREAVVTRPDLSQVVVVGTGTNFELARKTLRSFDRATLEGFDADTDGPEALVSRTEVVEWTRDRLPLPHMFPHPSRLDANAVFVPGSACSGLSATTTEPTTTTTLPPTTTAAPPPTTAAPLFPAPVVTNGQGDDVIPIQLPDATGTAVVYARHSGAANFIVQAGGDLLVNTIGAYEGVTFLEFASPGTMMEVSADGPWTIEIRSILSIRRFDTTVDGVGDDVLFYEGATAPMAWAHQGAANFIVRADGSSGQNLAINTIGPYEGTVLIDGSSVIVVTADGSWSSRPG